MMLCKIWLLGFLIFPLVISHNLPQDALGDTLTHGATDVHGPPVTDAELEASLLDASLLEPLPEDSPIATQTGYFQGDIILQSEDEPFEQKLTGLRIAAKKDTKWPDAVIPYMISSQFSDHERGVIVRAIAEFKSKTCIRFTPKNNQNDYVDIIKGGGCSSSVGRIGGRQELKLVAECVDFATVLHELMHAAGFWHEQSRNDRDDHIIIHWQNIKMNHTRNFDQKTKSVTKDLGLPYDFESLMHYKWNEFGINKQKPTISPKERGQKIPRKRKGFSEVDVKGLNLHYGCDGKLIARHSGCADTNKLCSYWARKGECAMKPEYMLGHCKKSCNKCGRR